MPAMQPISRAICEVPMNTKEKVLLHKGMDRVRRMQYDEAVEFFDKVLAMNPEIAEAWSNKGVALFRMGRTDEAIECYNRSLAIDSKNLDALRNKGFVLMRAGRLEEALECYDSLLKAGGVPEDLESKATVLAGMGRLEEALDCMFEAINAKPLERFEDEINALKQMIEIGKSKISPAE